MFEDVFVMDFGFSDILAFKLGPVTVLVNQKLVKKTYKQTKKNTPINNNSKNSAVFVSKGLTRCVSFFLENKTLLLAQCKNEVYSFVEVKLKKIKCLYLVSILDSCPSFM